MPNAAELPSFAIWCYVCIALFTKMFTNSLVQGVVRIRLRHYLLPEDAKFFGRGVDLAEAEHPLVVRAAGCWRNDLENIPMFLILGLGFVVAGGPKDMAQLYFWGYTVFRVLHTLFYLRPMQPWRNIAYQGGTLATLAVAVHLVLLLQGFES